MMLHSVCLIAEEEAENIDFLSQVLSINFSGIPRFNAAHQSANRIKTDCYIVLRDHKLWYTMSGCGHLYHSHLQCVNTISAYK